MKTKMPTNLLPTSHYVSDYTVFCHPEDEPKDMLAPKNFAHVARKLKPGDTIMFMAEDISWECLTRVRAVSKHEVAVSVIHECRHDTVPVLSAPMGGERLEPKWRGPARKWSVVDEGGTILKENYETREQAEAYIKNRVKAAA